MLLRQGRKDRALAQKSDQETAESRSSSLCRSQISIPSHAAGILKLLISMHIFVQAEWTASRFNAVKFKIVCLLRTQIGGLHFSQNVFEQQFLLRIFKHARTLK
jgi:uncharacterized membrane protein